jgi:citrate synthase
MSDTTPTVTLTTNERSAVLPVMGATEGADGIVVGTVLAETGLVTLDPGFTNTASCQSKITFIDGDASVLHYRGYPIEQLALQSSYLEVCYLLIHGELPTKTQMTAWERRLRRHTHLHENFTDLIQAFPSSAHPMVVLSSAVAALAGYYPHSVDPFDPETVELATVLLLAKTPTIAAYAHKHSLRQELPAPSKSETFAGNFLRMAFTTAEVPYEVDPVLARALDILFILHADHEQNCSTSIVRMVGSAHANLYASVSSGLNALAGPLHGGANEEVLTMLNQIRSSEETTESFMDRVKDRDDATRLMGFGHRVYKSYDPRAAIAKELCDQVLERTGGDELLDIAIELEQIALNDDYFVERQLYPNIDFYTGIIYQAIGFRSRMFTQLFAVGRTPGWIAQWREMMSDPATRICRPRQVYTGPTIRDYVPIDQRAVANEIS